MKTSFSLSIAVLAIVLMGAGCFGGGEAPTSGGVWQSSDAGKTWTQTAAIPTATGVATLANVDVTALALDPQDETVLYAGTRENGMFMSLDGGISWQRPEDERARSGNVVSIAVSTKDVCTYFVAKPERIMKTENCGRTFNTETYLETRTDEAITAMALDWYDPNIVWITNTAGDVIRSLDGGKSWATVSHRDATITSIAISNADSRIIFVGTKSDGLVRSEDSGATWVEYEKTLKDYKASDRVYGFAQNADGSVTVMNTQYGLLVSKDRGATWTGVSLISSGGEVKIYSVAVAPDNGDVIYYGTSNTLNRSISGGSAWTTTALPTSRAAGALLVMPGNDANVVLGSSTVVKD